MAIKKLKGMIWGRFITLVLIFAIPAFFAIIVAGSELGWFDIITWQDFLYLNKAETISFMPPGWAKFFVWFCIPFFFSLPWVAFLIIDANRVGETFDNMGRAMRKVSLGLNIFYSINALIVFIFFLLPFGSPLIVVVASFGMIPWIIKKKTGKKLPRWLTFIPGLLLSAIPIVLAIGFYANYGEAWNNLWGLWSGDLATGTTTLTTYGLVHYLYGFGYSLAIGAVLAGFVSFMYEGAASVDRSVKRPKGILYIVEFLIAAGIFTLYLLIDMGNQPTRDILFYVISGLAIFVALVEFILRFFKKTKRGDKDNVPMGAYIMLPIFIGVDLIRTAGTLEVRNYALTGALALSCIVYLVLFLLAYSFAGETYTSRWSKSKDDDDDDDDDDDSSDDEY
ncbi:MAG TPA: hypothetical protein VMZ29_14565 [Candidatus Bathyarchaeia archaeon]|nr:hypothetical protein [Candidatus Bathyarchaeia archaeon]